jgi:nucleoside triphosphate pyrophosphatase
METIHLISGSPRRQTLLNQMGLTYKVCPVDTEEFMDPAKGPDELARAIAEEKLHAFLENKPDNVKWAVAADTFIFFDGRTVGKPVDREDACRELNNFSGHTHQVYTGITLFCSNTDTILTDVDVTDVTFRDLTENEIQWYLNTEEWKDVAGSYRIQEKGECLIQGINGSYSCVMGLPITLFYGMLSKLNYKFDKFPVA